MSVVLNDTIETLRKIGDQLDLDVSLLRQLLSSVNPPRVVILTGVGKSFCVAQLGASLLQSVGVIATVVHATDALHGGLGMMITARATTIITVSHSGETQEVLDVVSSVRSAAPATLIIAITSSVASKLGSAVDTALTYDCERDGSRHETIPSVSVAAQLAWLNVLVCSRANILDASELAEYHPGGSLNRRYREEIENKGVKSE